MTILTPIEGAPLVNLDDLPQRCAEERLEYLARELMTVTAMLEQGNLLATWGGTHLCAQEK
jgi:hypothetical protein